MKMLECEDQHILDILLDSIRKMTFVCDLCGSIVFPNVLINEDGTFNVSQESADIRGKGGRVIKRAVCKDCVKKMQLYKSLE